MQNIWLFARTGIPTGILTIILACSLSALAEVEFYRSCATAVQCVFEPRGSSDRVYLDCQNGRCECSNFPAIADVPVWNLNWNPSSQDCLIDEFGPCGRENGLEVSCRPGLECINSRCRSSQRIRTHKRGEYCKDDIDCEPGLKCKTVAFYFQPQKSCVNEEEEKLKAASVEAAAEEEKDREDRQAIARGGGGSSSSRNIQGETMQTSIRLNVTDKSPSTSPSPSLVITQEVQNKTSAKGPPVVAPSNPTQTSSNHLMEGDDDDDVPISADNKASCVHNSLLTFSMFTSVLISFVTFVTRAGYW